MRLPALWIAAAFAAGIGAASRWPASLRVWLAATLVALVLGGVLAWRDQVRCAGACALLAWGKLEVSVLDVGQGDSIFAAFPDGRTMLMDGGGVAGPEWIGGHRSGPDVGEEVVSPYLWSRGLKRLDVVALTHAHHNHLDGLHSVLENFSVGELWIGRDEETHAFQSLCEEARARGVTIVHLTGGERFDWQGVRGEVLAAGFESGQRSFQ